MKTILIPGAEIYYDKNFLSPEEATTLFNALRAKCAWERRRSSFGAAVPRDETYYAVIREPATSILGASIGRCPGFRNCFPSRLEFKRLLLTLLIPLCNLYRNGNDSVGLHADAEPEMGPVIASVSLGAERLFRLKGPKGTVAFAERLPHGSLLIMAGETQKNFKHEVPKEPAITEPRINLTFRNIEHN